MFRVRELTFFGLALGFVLTVTPAAPAQFSEIRRDVPALKSAFKDVVAKPSECTVRVISDDQGAALGAIVSADGYIVTKASELRGKLLVRLKDGRSYAAQLVGVDDQTDLGLLKISATGLSPVSWRESKSAEVGNWVVAPRPESDPVAALGVVSVATRKPSAVEGLLRTAPKSNSGYLGIRLGMNPNDEGPTISDVTARSPAEKAGLEVGDMILTVAGRIIRSPDRLVNTIQGLRPGQSVTITVKRGKEEKEVIAKLSQFPMSELDRGAKMNMLGSELSYRLGGFPVILQHDLLIKPSDCGGPLVDLDGKTVGINIARAGRTESYAIPSEAVQSLLPALKSGKLAPKDEMEDKQVSQVRKMIREVRDDIAKAVLKRSEMDDDASNEAKKAADDDINDLRKKLSSLQEELDKLRNPKPKN